MQPRQSGKTSKAIYEYIKNRDNSLFVTTNIGCRDHVRKLLGEEDDHVISAGNLTAKINREPLSKINFTNVIMDSYMYYERKEEINKLIKNTIQPDNLYIFSTSDRAYSKKLFEIVKIYKGLNLSCEGVYAIYKSRKGKLPKKVKQEIYDLYYNFITDKDIILVDKNMNYDPRNKKHFKKMIGKKAYKVEILNKYFK